MLKTIPHSTVGSSSLIIGLVVGMCHMVIFSQSPKMAADNTGTWFYCFLVISTVGSIAGIIMGVVGRGQVRGHIPSLFGIIVNSCLLIWSLFLDWAAWSFSHMF